MKKDITYVDQDKFLAICQALGLRTREQAGFVQVALPNSPRLYVAKTKRVGRIDVAVGEIDLSSLPGVRQLGIGEAFGKVHHRIDFSLPEADVLSNFEGCLKFLSSLPAPEPKAKKEPKARVVKAKVTKAAPEPTPEEAEAKAQKQKEREILIRQAVEAKKARQEKSAAKATAS